jgi:hypothetical protein
VELVKIGVDSCRLSIFAGWSARDCISWLRIARPGCVIGSQQHYLESCQEAISKGLPLPEPASRKEGCSDRLARQVQLGMLGRCDKDRGGRNRVADLIGKSCEVAVSPDEAALIANLEGSSGSQPVEAERRGLARSHSHQTLNQMRRDAASL